MTNFEEYLKASEQETAKRAINTLLMAGYRLSVFDGEEITVKKSTDHEAIQNAMGTTGEDYLFVYSPDHKDRLGWVRFVWGNEDWVVVADHTTNLNDVLKPVFDWMEEQQDEQTARKILRG